MNGEIVALQVLLEYSSPLNIGHIRDIWRTMPIYLFIYLLYVSPLHCHRQSQREECTRSKRSESTLTSSKVRVSNKAHF